MIKRITKFLEKIYEKHSVVVSPIAYMHKKKRNKKRNKEDEYTLVKSNIISGVGNSKCDDLGGGNNCTLTGVYNIMLYYRQQGFDRIPDNNTELYEVIKTQANKLGYNSKDGLPVTKNDDIVRNMWHDGLGYSTGNGRSRYIWRHKKLINEIDNDRPFIFSLASGVYFNHTIVVYGYEVYKNERTGKEYTFLIAADAWSNQ